MNNYVIPNLVKACKIMRILAAPVRDSGGQVIAAIGVTGPAAQYDSQKKTDICTHVKKVAEKLSAKLGYIA
jgi:DNA-binding IclR family transcriptional regulator